MKKFLQNKGQSSLEYTILIIMLCGALLAISLYFKRSLQGRWKDTVDGLGDQYDPRYTKSNIIYEIESNTFTSVFAAPFGCSGNMHTARIDTTSSKESKKGQMEVRHYTQP